MSLSRSTAWFRKIWSSSALRSLPSSLRTSMLSSNSVLGKGPCAGRITCCTISPGSPARRHMNHLRHPDAARDRQQLVGRGEGWGNDLHVRLHSVGKEQTAVLETLLKGSTGPERPSDRCDPPSDGAIPGILPPGHGAHESKPEIQDLGAVDAPDRGCCRSVRRPVQMSWGRISDNEGIERSRQVGMNS